MKKFLLLACVLPCLLSAQNAKVKHVLKDKMSIQQVLKSIHVKFLNNLNLVPLLYLKNIVPENKPQRVTEIENHLRQNSSQ